MSVSVWNEMNAAGHPLDANGIDGIRQMAQFSADSAREIGRSTVSDAEALGFIIVRNSVFRPLTPTTLIAVSLGFRAQRYDLDIRDPEGSGYRFDEAGE